MEVAHKRLQRRAGEAVNGGLLQRGVRVVFVGRDRVIWKMMVLQFVTLGIYRRVWLYRVNKELDGHEALGLNHKVNVLLLCLPLLGPWFVAYQTSRRTGAMLDGTAVRYGSPVGVWLFTVIPVAGNFAYMAWVQSKLNRFWAVERKHPEHGIEIDIALESDLGFVIEVARALKQSYHPGSRFDAGKRARRERWAARREVIDGIQEQRAVVRAAGGSTPVLPWRRPQRPAERLLHVSCGRCERRFDVVQDPTAETPIVCPQCGLAEVLPSLHSDQLAPAEKVGVAALKVKCPQCGTKFQGVRNLDGPTELVCPQCGRRETVDIERLATMPAKRKK